MSTFSSSSVIILLLLFSSACGRTKAATTNMLQAIIKEADEIEALRHGKHGSTLYRIVSSPQYEDDLLLLDLHGTSRFEQGYDAGLLIAHEARYNYDHLLEAVLGTGFFSSIFKSILGRVLDWQWKSYLSKDVPEHFMEEIRGFDAGVKEMGFREGGNLLCRGITLANLPGSLENIQYVLKDQANAASAVSQENGGRGIGGWLWMIVIKGISAFMGGMKVQAFQCSNAAVWGIRTQVDTIFSFRNLDWQSQTGIAKYKLITIHHPPEEGKIAHACIGFAGLWGSLTGISAEGLTIHEANLEQQDITFRGFPWTLRCRLVLEEAHNLKEAERVWDATRNTVGFIFQIVSGKERASVVMETMKDYTAYFRSQESLDDVLFRTNHGFDPKIVRGFAWNDTIQYNDSLKRYQLLQDAFAYYKDNNISVGAQETVNIGALLGKKGPDSYDCSGKNTTGGANVLSVAYDPQEYIVYAAWEEGQGEEWIPAACQPYLAIDVKPWLHKEDRIYLEKKEGSCESVISPE